MPYLIEFLLFLLPFAAYAVWRWYNPGIEPGPRVMAAAAAGVLLMLLFAIWYGLSVSMAPHEVYVPAHLGPDGRVVPGRLEPAR
ncbi:hypothetical protein [Paracraurococcus lichenis]|uniref:Uncharacterized protein n=1 Tax=Paracraurococcus lichenis TaxID=3064888 RepID=A0ABT9E498_9PROT|nr:hypothetical protein [Paracraurococcus sp. LOR1-02]MDO9710994.1 hypothetical protein [Paracraurococcus sp. LOR1-02]